MNESRWGKVEGLTWTRLASPQFGLPITLPDGRIATILIALFMICYFLFTLTRVIELCLKGWHNFFFFLHYEHYSHSVLDNCEFAISDHKKKLSVRVRFSNAMPPFIFFCRFLLFWLLIRDVKDGNLNFPPKFYVVSFSVIKLGAT